MKVSIIVAAVPHYFAARIKAFASCVAETILVNAGSSEEFYSSISGHDIGLARLVSIESSKPLGFFDQATECLSQQQPDVVVIAGWATAESFAGMIWAKQNGKRLVVMSASQQADAARTPIREFLKSRIVRNCDTAIVGGRLHKDYITLLGMPEAHVFLGYNAVDNQHFQRGADQARADGEVERRRLGLPARYVLASSRFIPKKNLPRLIMAYAKAIKGLPDSPDLVLLGDGPERRSVEAAILENEIAGRVHLMGFRSYDLLPSFYGLAEGFVHVSTAEQWGLVINEAAAAGLPLIVSAPCGAAPELVREGVNGWVVDPLNVDEITIALSRLIALSPSERSAMANAGRRIVADWGPERFAAGLSAACHIAASMPPRTLMPWDRMLIRFLATRQIKTVA